MVARYFWLGVWSVITYTPAVGLLVGLVVGDVLGWLDGELLGNDVGQVEG